MDIPNPDEIENVEKNFVTPQDVGKMMAMDRVHLDNDARNVRFCVRWFLLQFF